MNFRSVFAYLLVDCIEIQEVEEEEEAEDLQETAMKYSAVDSRRFDRPKRAAEACRASSARIKCGQ